MISLIASMKKKEVDKLIKGNKQLVYFKICPQATEGEDTVFKIYIYENKRGGGSGNVIDCFYAVNPKLFDFEYSEWAYSVAPAGASMPLSEDALWADAVRIGGFESDDEFRKFLSESSDNYKLFVIEVSGLEIFDKPKSLNKFVRYDYEIGSNVYEDSEGNTRNDSELEINGRYEIKKPPAGWIYGGKLSYLGAE